MTDARPWPANKVVRRKVAELLPYARNARTHSDEQVEQLMASIRRWGWTVPVLVDEKGTIIAGHGRVLAAQRLGVDEVPAMVARGWSEEEKRAYVLADNQLALNAGWDEDLLRFELVELKAADFDLGVIGFDAPALKRIMAEVSAGLRDADEVPEAEAVAVTAAGDLWQLGDHRVLCGDSTAPADVAQLMGDRRAKLLHADPPYGMGKEADGVENDNLYAEKLDRFQLDWWRAFRPYLTDNASVYIWGNAPDLWRLWWRGGLAESEPMTLRNEIVWDKKSIAGMASPLVYQYPTASERCLFVQLGRHVLQINQTKDDYWPGWEPIRTWLCAQRDAAGFKGADVRRICGNHMYGHWFGQSQWVFISRDNYDKLAEAAQGRAFVRPYDDLLAEYRDLQARFNGEVREDRVAEFNAARPYFDNAHEVMRDVWEFDRVVGEERHGHATPKPVAMMERVMRSSLREREVAIEPFGGTGSTLMGAETTGRVCYAMELQPRYVDVIVRRWQEFTGRAAVLEGDGRTFDEVAAERAEAPAEAAAE